MTRRRLLRKYWHVRAHWPTPPPFAKWTWNRANELWFPASERYRRGAMLVEACIGVCASLVDAAAAVPKNVALDDTSTSPMLLAPLPPLDACLFQSDTHELGDHDVLIAHARQWLERELCRITGGCMEIKGPYKVLAFSADASRQPLPLASVCCCTLFALLTHNQYRRLHEAIQPRFPANPMQPVVNSAQWRARNRLLF
jgi:hypothetical protein